MLNLRRILIIAGVFVCLAGRSYGQDTALRIASISWYEYKASQDEDGQIQKGAQTQHIVVHYSPQGKMTDSAVFNESGTKIKQFTFVHDPEGNLLEKTFYNQKAEIINRAIYHYNQQMRPLSYQVVGDSGKVLEKQVYTYMPDNSYEVRRYLKGNLADTYIYACDSDDYKYPLKVSKKTDSIRFVQKTYQYDAKKRITTEKGFSSDGQIDYWYDYQYNENNKIENKLSYNRSGELSRKYTFVYDNQGNMTEEFWYAKDDYLIYKQNYSYKYDEHQNWMLKLYYEGIKPVLKRMTEKTVNYYEN
ncbi:MAG: hypothetical protein LBR36_09920 [Bacteroidales bacterium]|jgi:YD repeat-containing protein|nr:hypothetical protein [Bacteroidales bacterium]